MTGLSTCSVPHISGTQVDYKNNISHVSGVWEGQDWVFGRTNARVLPFP